MASAHVPASPKWGALGIGGSRTVPRVWGREPERAQRQVHAQGLRAHTASLRPLSRFDHHEYTHEVCYKSIKPAVLRICRSSNCRSVKNGRWGVLSSARGGSRPRPWRRDVHNARVLVVRTWTAQSHSLVTVRGSLLPAGQRTYLFSSLLLPTFALVIQTSYRLRVVAGGVIFIDCQTRASRLGT